MIFKSKMIYDPNQKYGNYMGLTIGLTFHTPKFFNCKRYDFYISQFDTMRDGLTDEQMEERYLSKLAHEKCKRKFKPLRHHLSYPGYMYWTGPKRRYTFRYMGATHSREKWYKPFSVSKHTRYTRLLDNGPQNKPQPDMSDIVWSDAMQAERRRFADTMERSRSQMREYERVRSAGPR